MEILSLCPFQVGTLLWEAQPGQFSLTVLVKATFVLTPGEVTVASDQDPLGADRHWDNNPMASLYRPSDFAPAKKRVDLTLVGHAYASGAREATSVVARMQIGELSKSARVTGDRLWVSRRSRPIEPSQPAPFRRVALRYERAQIGPDNLVGIDPTAPPSPGMHALPNLERVSGEGAGVPCFGPIAPTWRARRRLLAESALGWAHDISTERGADAPRLAAAPAGFDFEFFNSAPRDQQVDLLRPGAPIVLEHLDPEHPRLETRLAPYRPQVFRVPPSAVANGRTEEIAVRCDTLWVDSDRGVVVLVWRGLAEIARPSPDAIGRLVVAADPQGRKLRWAAVEKSLREGDATVQLSRSAVAQVDTDAPDPLGQRYDGLKEPPGATAVVADPLTEELTTLRHDAVTPGALREAVEIFDEEPTRDSARRSHKITLPLFPPPAAGRAPIPTSPFTDAELGAPVPEVARLSDDPSTEDRTPPLPAEVARTDDADQSRAPGKPPPIGVREYAKLQLGLERGEVGKVLAELGLQLTDLVRIQRQWAVRVALNPVLASDLAEAVDELKRVGR